MKKVYLIITFFSCALLSQSMDYQRYKFKITEQDDCYLYVYKDNHYYMEVYSQRSLDIVEAVILSFGECLIENGHLKLNDKMNGYSQLFSFEKNGIKGVQTYVFLKEKLLSLDREGNEEHPDFFGFRSDNISSSCNRIKIELNSGIFINRNGIRIELQEKKRFYVYYDTVPLFFGSFYENEKNKIYLRDLQLNHTFKLFILDENTLKGNLIISKDNIYRFTSFWDYYFGTPFI